MELSDHEQQVVDVFKEAGFSGRVFRSVEACRKYLERSRGLVIGSTEEVGRHAVQST